MVPTVGEGQLTEEGREGDTWVDRGLREPMWPVGSGGGGAGYRRLDENPLERGIGSGMREKALEGSLGTTKSSPLSPPPPWVLLQL